MKRFYISFAVLAAVIIYCIVGSLIVTNNSKYLTNDIDNIMNDITETYNIVKMQNGAGIQTETETLELEKNLLVSSMGRSS